MIKAALFDFISDSNRKPYRLLTCDSTKKCFNTDVNFTMCYCPHHRVMDSTRAVSTTSKIYDVTIPSVILQLEIRVRFAAGVAGVRPCLENSRPRLENAYKN